MTHPLQHATPDSVPCCTGDSTIRPKAQSALIARTFVALAAGSLPLIVLSAAAGSPAESRVDTESALKPAKPLVHFVGQDIKVTERRFVLVRTDGEWQKFWAEHAGLDAPGAPYSRSAAPKVDFSRCLVVGVFNGVALNTDGQVVESITSGPDSVRVRFETSSFQTSSFGPEPDPGVKTTSFGLWVIDSMDKPIVIEQARRELKDQAVRWEEVKRFGPK